MSSHHFVTDDQEPPLLIHGATVANSKTLCSLLEWNPTIYASSNSAHHIEALGVKIDHIFCYKNDVEELAGLRDSQAPISLVSLEEGADFWIAVGKYFKVIGKKSLNVYTSLKKIEREDFLNDLWPITLHLNLTVFTPTVKCIYVRNGEYSKWAGENDRFSIIVDPNVDVRTSPNISKTSDPENEKMFVPSVDGFVTFSSEQGNYWLIEYLQNDV